MAYDGKADLFNREIFRELLEAEPVVCVSIYMPAEQVGKEVRQNAIRFDNLMREADEKLRRYGVADSERERIMAPLEDLRPDNDFWQHQSEGLAAFSCPKSQKILRLPVRFDEICVVDKRFYIRPLIALADQSGQYHVLALSRGETRLLHCTTAGCEREELPEHLTSYEKFLQQYDYEEHLQYHYGDRVGGGDLHAFRHGHGGGKEEAHHTHLKEYFSHLRHAVDKCVGPTSQTLLLAGDSHEIGLYREVASGTPFTVDILVQKNASELTDSELREMASEHEAPAHDRKRRSALEEYEQLRSADPGRVESNLHEVIRAVHDRRVRVLFVPGEDNQVWGHYDPEGRKLEIESQPDDTVGEEITNLAASVTLRNGGEVYVMPHAAIEQAEPFKPLAAIYTW